MGACIHSEYAVPVGVNYRITYSEHSSIDSNWQVSIVTSASIYGSCHSPGYTSVCCSVLAFLVVVDRPLRKLVLVRHLHDALCECAALRLDNLHESLDEGLEHVVLRVS